MYSWMASWFSGTKEQTLLVHSQTSSDDWTWIEVIREADDREIFIQTSETEVNRNVRYGPFPKKKRPQKRRLSLQVKAFRKTIDVDFPLHKQPRQLKAKGIQRQPVSLKALCRRTRSVSEILSCAVNLEEELDLRAFIEKAALAKSILDILLKADVKTKEQSPKWQFRSQLSIGWKEKQECIEWKKDLLAIEYGEPILSIERQPILSIEYKPEPLFIQWQDELKAIETKHTLPDWMKRIDVIEEPFPDWLMNIDDTLFKDTHKRKGFFKECYENYEADKLPAWMTSMDIFDDDWLNEANKSNAGVVNDMSSWIEEIYVEDDKSFYGEIESSTSLAEIDDFVYDPFNTRAGNIVELYENPYAVESELLRQCFDPTIRVDEKKPNWLNTASPQVLSERLINRLQSICESVMEVTMLIASCTSCASDGSRKHAVAPIVTRELIYPREENRSRAKKNKKWLKRSNDVQKVICKRRKLLPINFSGRRGARAC